MEERHSIHGPRSKCKWMLKLFRRDRARDMLQYISEHLILTYRYGYTVIWIDHYGIKEDEMYSGRIKKSG
jgi:hypothetical protein